MEIIRQHQNGTILEAYKTFEELTTEELELLVIPAGSRYEDYATYRVDKNKKGELTRVKHQFYSEVKKAELNDRVDVADMFRDVEKLIKDKNVDRETAYRATFVTLGLSEKI